MRLLQRDSAGHLSLTKDLIRDIPAYAILSHTWGADTEEVSYRDVVGGTGRDKSGYKKIHFCGDQARRDDLQLQYFWVDTCCIDKSNSAELGEAINSMFRWYQNAARCYVYLADVLTESQDQSVSWQSAFQQSLWFTRGWTLQELIAPRCVEFFCSNGNRLGDKKTLEQELHKITKIPFAALRGNDLSGFSVEERMSWANRRNTTREEDRAYSLLGIFGIHMPLIYGEGADNAFNRLQDELQKRQNRKHQLADQSIISYPAFNFSKRLRLSNNQSSHARNGCNLTISDNGPSFSPEHSVPINNSSEIQERSIEAVDCSIDPTIKQTLIDQLYFAKIDERLIDLAAAQGSTCRWFLSKTEYTSWCNTAQSADHGGFLWLKGHPGTGKSTLMKLLFEETKLRTRADPFQITISFFFLARGALEEKSTTGLYRSLLHQLFEKAADLKDSLEWMTTDGARVIQRTGWHEEALKHTITHAVRKLGSRSLTIFIDALDECDKSQVAGMVSFFEDLCGDAEQAEVRLRICFSSRHYPTIIIQRGMEVILESETGHTQDIEHYIKSKLRLGKSKQAESLRSEILEKSAGIFLWVVLVLDILNSEHSSGSASIKNLRERLREIPPKLSELFEMILEQDGENPERLQLCLKWILFATRPLKPPELYFAIQLGLDKEFPSHWDQDDIDLDQMKVFVRSSSKGLAEVTRNRSSEVQFIHESVRDYLLHKYEGQWTGVSTNFIGHGHETLRACCLVQLDISLNDRDFWWIQLHHDRSAIEGVLGWDKRRMRFPFLEYSVLNVLGHANSAQQNALHQGDFLSKFPLPRWRILNNAIEKFENRRYTETATILYILAEKNLAELIKIHPLRAGWGSFEVGDDRYGPPIFAAMAMGSHEAVQALLDAQADIWPDEPLLRNLCKQYSEDSNNRVTFGRTFTFLKSRGIFFHLVEQGHETICALLCASARFDIESKAKFGETPLLWASQLGHDLLVGLLIKRGANLKAKDDRRRTPLVAAAYPGHHAVVKLLLENGSHLELPHIGQGLLFMATARGYTTIVELLLEYGVKIEAKNYDERTALMEGVLQGQEAVVGLLLEKGANIEATNYDGRTPLILAALKGNEVVARLLLEKGANIMAKEKVWSKTALRVAAETGNSGTVRLLLENGAEIEEQCVDGYTPLAIAKAKRHHDVVTLLLENGAKPA